jgi:hypothetical protein
MVSVFEQLDRIAERRDHRPVLAADTVDRLEPDPHARPLCLAADCSQPFDDCPTVVTGPGQAHDAARLELGEAMHGRTDRVDPLAWILRSLHQR